MFNLFLILSFFYNIRTEFRTQHAEEDDPERLQQIIERSIKDAEWVVKTRRKKWRKKIMSAQPVYIRYQVLKIYKTFIRLSQNWTSSVPSQTGIEKNYIIDETRKLFKANKNLTKPHEINEALREAEARLAMAQHYRNPYPRSSLFSRFLNLRKNKPKRVFGL